MTYIQSVGNYLHCPTGFVLLPRRWVVERSFGWKNRFRRLVRDYERLAETVVGLHFLAFATLMLSRLFAHPQWSS